MPLLSIQQLRFGWHPAAPVLAIDSLTLEAGSSLFLRGPSGSGKSTLLNLIGGVLQPQQGEIELLGTPLTRLKGSARDRLRADHIGFVFQQFNLLPYLSAIDNVTLPCGYSALRRRRCGDPQAQAALLLERLGLARASWTRPAAQLSVGQQQRVAAARALIGAPELVIADEPTSALDSDARDGFLQLLFEECRRAGSALLFVSHDRSLESHFDRALDLPTLNRVATEGTC